MTSQNVAHHDRSDRKLWNKSGTVLTLNNETKFFRILGNMWTNQNVSCLAHSERPHCAVARYQAVDLSRARALC